MRGLILHISLIAGLVGNVFASDDSLRSHVTIRDSQLRIGDILQDAPRAVANRRVLRPFKPGERRSVRCADLEKAIRSAYGAKVERAISACEDYVEIEREMSLVPADRVETMIRERIAGRLSSDATYAFQGVEPLRLPVEYQQLQLTRVPSELRTGRQSAQWKYVSNGKTRTLSSHFSVVVRVPTIVTRHSIRKGARLESDDIEVRREPFTDQGCNTLSDPQMAIGMESAKRLAAGEAICDTALIGPRLVRRGDLVTLRLEQGRLLISGLGVAQQQGRRGETIRVKNTESNRMVYGQVIGDKQVKVQF